MIYRHGLDNFNFSCRIVPSLGEVAEWSKAAVLKTVEPKGSQGSNPCLSAININELHSIVRFRKMSFIICDTQGMPSDTLLIIVKCDDGKWQDKVCGCISLSLFGKVILNNV